ncbi:ATP-dependent 6-phosphofructokinase [Nannocystis sp. ILAH1]|uniref:6-phosphofructokinase n=1 Tax=unclassified Nannocystis TaxID=2627009 RepID=UPI00227018A4|nr:MULTISPECIES: ATP-dependent 6-phosphofructokinase [unclassified Nannocystis]MCY0985536.1 ATP-dependent 6-phosphofructokinase [Nannocystis sp. ILAH1]MCY1068222.1 ATP-dependent 6-phosphofructokinase [Nannocystis sp. RBIL2]
MSIGILTSGGDAPGMNAAVRAAFRCLKMRDPDCEIVFFRDGFRGLARRLDSSSDRNVDRRAVRDIIHRGGTFIGTGRVPELLLPPEGHASYAERVAARDDFLKVAAINLYQMRVDNLIVIGGDGSFRGARIIGEAFRQHFPRRPFRVIGIPGTIDNDLHGTEYSIGYDTALNNVVDAIRKLRDTIESHRRAIILEVMGNTSGWLALQSAIAGGAAVVAIPEVEETWDHDRIVRSLDAGVRRDYRYFIIVVAEGVRRRAGEDWCEGLKHKLESDRAIESHLGHPMEVRINSVGHIARGGSPTALDNTLAGLLGSGAADVAQIGGLEGQPIVEGDVMVGCRGPRTILTGLDEVIDHSPRLVTRDSELYQLSQRLMLSAEQPF